MEDNLTRLRRWASHGTLRQFYTELDARLAKEGYKLELEGDTLTVYTEERKGGIFGIGGRKVRKTLLQVISRDDTIEVPEESADPEFVALLAERLRAH